MDVPVRRVVVRERRRVRGLRNVCRTATHVVGMFRRLDLTSQNHGAASTASNALIRASGGRTASAVEYRIHPVVLSEPRLEVEIAGTAEIG